MDTLNRAPVPPLFILCPPRSFSSLACAMLGQHPELYGMPELNLFFESTLGATVDRHQSTGRPHGLHGLLRALAQLHDGEQGEEAVRRARAWVEQHRGWTTRRVFDHLSELIAPRALVDKSPGMVLSPRFLERILDLFPDASFLHLTRHPRATGQSLVKLVEREDWVGPMRRERLEPERIWREAHANVVAFARRLPEGQCMRLKGEALLSDPHLYLPQICQWLGVRDDAAAIAAMLHPEASPFACPGPPSAPYGNDPNFLDSPALRPGAVTEPRLAGDLEWAPGQQFTPATVKLAKEFGYR